MKQSRIQINETGIWIYRSLWKDLLLAICCLAFAAGGCYILKNDDAPFFIKIIAGWLNVIFFGGGGLLLLLSTLYNRFRHIPLLIIYDDRVEQYVLLKRTYQTIKFEDVKGFHLINSKMISVDYKEESLQQKFENSSGFMQRLMSLNLMVAGTVDAISTDNLTMKGKDICNILNERLKRFLSC